MRLAGFGWDRHVLFARGGGFFSLFRIVSFLDRRSLLWLTSLIMIVTTDATASASLFRQLVFVAIIFLLFRRGKGSSHDSVFSFRCVFLVPMILLLLLLNERRKVVSPSRTTERLYADWRQ